jgi:hypothetical protein
LEKIHPEARTGGGGAMATRYLVTLKGEFEEIQAVVAETQESAKEKALRFLGETINRKPVGALEVIRVKEMESDR